MRSGTSQTRIEAARDLAQVILDDFDKGLSVTKVARKCEHLGRLTDDQFIQAYVNKCMTWSEGQDMQSLFRWLKQLGPTAEASGVVQFLEDYKTKGPSVGGFLLGSTAQAGFAFFAQSLPSAETFVQNARKKANYSIGQSDFLRSIEQAERVIDRVSTRLYRYASYALLRLRFGSIPESILEATRRQVDRALAEKCPGAIEKFAVAYEELARTSPENWSNACLEARRILRDFADAVYPPRDTAVNGHGLGPEDYVNRLWAYASKHIKSRRTKDLFSAELKDIGGRVDAIYDLSSKGLHATIAKAEADRTVIRAYLLLADLLSL
jgi:hypothetical protein